MSDFIKYIAKFDTEAEYQAFLESTSFVRPNVSLVAEAEERLRYNPILSTSYDLYDILWSDGTTTSVDDSTYVRATSEGVVPIGLCVAPTGFFGTNSAARFMSLKYMYSGDKANGVVIDASAHPGSYGVVLGTYGADEGLTKFSYIYSTYTNGYLTADWITSTNNKIPTILNDSVYATFDSTVGMSDIDGKTNTTTWATNDLLSNSAIDCALTYAPTGTSAGDWYIPAIGELACVATYKTTINAKLAAIAAVYSSDSIAALTSYNVWSSTVQSTNNAYYVVLTSGRVYSYSRNYYGLAIAFLQL